MALILRDTCSTCINWFWGLRVSQGGISIRKSPKMERKHLQFTNLFRYYQSIAIGDELPQADWPASVYYYESLKLDPKSITEIILQLVTALVLLRAGTAQKLHWHYRYSRLWLKVALLNQLPGSVIKEGLSFRNVITATVVLKLHHQLR